ncbi:MAG: cation:proton antiporter [Methanosarcinaceae archaeon]|nr:cation:proton antiporter [Methanosarcinaceae archaeon]NKQ38300.1 cation:proton antiporter [Methanosarcinales archaeon]
MHIILQILLILFTAKIFGEVFERIGFSSILGEISAGLFLSSVFFICPENEHIKFFAKLGVIFLLFISGYKETDPRELKAALKKSLFPTIFGIIIPFSFGFLLGMLFNFEFITCLFIGVVFTPTSIGVTARTFMDFGYLSRKASSITLNASILADIMALIMLTIILQINIAPEFSITHILIVGMYVIVFFIIMYIIKKILPLFFKYIQKMHVKESIFAHVIIVALLSAYLAKIFGLHGSIGAFIGGVIVSSIPIAKIKDVQDKVSGISYGIFIPFFFVYIGLSFDFSVIEDRGLFIVLFTTLALLGKIIGGFIGSKIAGFNSYDSLICGIGCMPRAGIGLMIATVGRDVGIIGMEIFSAIILMVVVSVMATPLFLKYAINLEKRNDLLQ